MTKGSAMMVPIFFARIKGPEGILKNHLHPLPGSFQFMIGRLDQIKTVKFQFPPSGPARSW